MTQSSLYFGRVRHDRLKPLRHRLDYRVFSLLLDLDEVEALAPRLRWFSYNRFNLFGFYDRDHGDGSGGKLRPYVEAHLRHARIDLAGGAIRLLCFPRILGYVFNPLSVYFCHHRDGDLRAIIYEVSNTFGQRHSYLITVADPSQAVIRQSCRKALYVSPFMPMECRYDFSIVAPGERMAIVIHQADAEGPVLGASLIGRRVTLSDDALLGTFFRYPLMTLKIIAGIHWEALKLWHKGMHVHRRPAPPAEAVTIVRGAGEGSLTD